MRREWIVFILLATCIFPRVSVAGLSGPADVVVILDGRLPKDGSQIARLGELIDELRDGNRLGVISAAEPSVWLRGLLPAATANEKDAAKLALDKAVFGLLASDLEGALALAIEQLTAGEQRAERFVLIVGAAGAVKPVDGASRLSTVLLPLASANKIAIWVIASGSEDLDRFTAISGFSGGRAIAGLDAQTMSDAFAIFNDAISPSDISAAADEESKRLSAAVSELSLAADKLRAAEKRKEPVETDRLPWIAVLALLALLLGALVVASFVLPVFLERRTKASERVSDGRAAAVRLKERVGELSAALRHAEAASRSLELDIEDFRMEAWQRERDFTARFHGLAGGVFLLLDHLELAAAEGGAADSSSLAFAEKLRVLLEEHDIAELAVAAGDRFDSARHKCVGERPGEVLSDTVVETTRRGYVARCGAKDSELVLRKAEVIVARRGEQSS